jgi:hypothetical protein
MRQATWSVVWYSKVILAVMCLCLVASGYSSAQTARDIAQKSFPSVVMLLMEDTNSQPLSLGSGFFVDDDLVATNLHVVEGASGGYAKIVGEKQKYDIAGFVGIDAQRDLVLLKITAARAPFLSLGDSRRVAVGDEIYAIGNPQGLEGTFSKGIISGIRKVGKDILLQITAPISPGSSGGPILNAQGEVIGVAVAAFRGGQNLNFAIPSSYLASLLVHRKPVSPLSAETAPREEESILGGLGGPSTEGVTGGQLTWRWEFHGFPGEYSFSLQNRLREAIRNVYCLVVFYDRSDNPIETDLVRFDGVIPGGLARRVTSEVHQSVQELTTPNGSQTPTTRIEFRVLDFRAVE